uniref:Uncharacterized protein n=1 Tax=viral metagenome TaxID=1070528 RepID=A0A6M3KNB5_9ZZZZ
MEILIEELIKSLSRKLTPHQIEYVFSHNLALIRTEVLPTPDITTDAEPFPCNETCHKAEQANMLKAGFTHSIIPLKELKEN